ncbi:MAG: M16 family metallopeptidase, partial [Candidatus Thorarchaeota archaeon]
VIERHTLPLFSIAVVFRAGSIYDPAEKFGLAYLCNDLLLRGTANRSAKEIVDEITFGGGQLTTYCDNEDAGFWGEFMTAYEETCFEMLGDVLRNSSFSEDELNKSRERIKGYLQGRFDDPHMLANELIVTQILGDDPYAHNPAGTVAGLDALTRADIVDFFNRYYTPDNCLVIVCGDIDSDRVKTRLETYMADSTRPSGHEPISSAFTRSEKAEILIINKEDASQTQIRVGGLGIANEHPDYLSLEAAKSVFSGSFMSRLVNEIRVNRGLAYAVDLADRNFGPGGIIYVSTSTRNESVGDVLEIIYRESETMQRAPVPDSELTAAINYRNGLYPLDFETNDDLLSPFIKMWLYDLEPPFYEDFQEKLRRTTPNDVMSAAQKYFPGADSYIVLIGPASVIESQVSDYGQVRVIQFEDL